MARVEVGTLCSGDILWYCDEAEIVLSTADGDQRMVCDNYPSTPCIAPNRCRFAFIAPRAFELVGDVYIYDPSTRTVDKLVRHQELPEGHTPKSLAWLSDRLLLLIAGYAFGSVSEGGDLYCVDVELRKSVLVAKAAHKQEFVCVEVLGERVALGIVEFGADWTVAKKLRQSFSTMHLLDSLERKFRR